MTDHFGKVAKKRARPSKQARSPDSGQFEALSPLNNPDLMHHCVRLIRAADDLLPVLALLARQQPGNSQETELERYTRIGARGIGAWLAAFRATLLDEISLDKEATRDAKKPRLMTAREAAVKKWMLEGKL